MLDFSSDPQDDLLGTGSSEGDVLSLGLVWSWSSAGDIKVSKWLSEVGTRLEEGHWAIGVGAYAREADAAMSSSVHSWYPSG